MGDRLSYYRICELARYNLYELIPSEYNIIFKGNKPCKKHLCIDGSNVTFTRNSFVQPTLVNITGEYVVKLPLLTYTNCSKLVDFGDVIVETEFEVTEFEFKYDPNLISQAYKQARAYFDYMPGSCRKCDMTFDCDILIDGWYWHMQNVLVVECSLPQLSYSPDDDDMMLVKLCTDYFFKDKDKL